MLNTPDITISLFISKGSRSDKRCALMRAAIEAALAESDPPERCELLVRLTGDAELRKFNAQFRGIDEATDVLSFATEQFKDGRPTRAYEHRPNVRFHLGEVYISLDRCVAQAAEHGHSTDDELRLMIVHGVLHLLGYDHMSPTRKRRMWAAQARAFKALGVVNPLRD
jgi:probable rRNA maturation factor